MSKPQHPLQQPNCKNLFLSKALNFILADIHYGRKPSRPLPPRRISAKLIRPEVASSSFDAEHLAQPVQIRVTNPQPVRVSKPVSEAAAMSRHRIEKVETVFDHSDKIVEADEGLFEKVPPFGHRRNRSNRFFEQFGRRLFVLPASRQKDFPAATFRRRHVDPAAVHR